MTALVDLKAKRDDRLFDDLVNAALPFALHDWMDAELEDDNCKLANGSGPITVGHWRRLRAVLSRIEPKGDAQVTLDAMELELRGRSDAS